LKHTGYSKLILLASSALWIIACGGDSPREANRSEGTDAAAEYRAQVDDWHAQRLERLQREDGWLSLVGLHLLSEGENRIGAGADNGIQLPGAHPDHIGSIYSESGSFRFESAKDVEVSAGDEVISKLELATDGGGAAEATLLQSGSLRFYVIQRGEHHYLRSKDSESEVRKNFHGIERYAVNEAWHIRARLLAFEEPRVIEIPNILGTTEARIVTGELVFTHEDKEYRLLPMGEPGQSLFLVFGDAGNGVTTYGGGRFLYTDPPGEDGSVMVDFNRSYNPPCVFTPYATCALPPESNILPFEVTAGEKNWGEEHH